MVDRTLQGCLRERAGLPTAPCPLNARVTGAIELDDCLIEKVVYDAEPVSSVTASLYRPKKMDGPAPAVVLASGHGGSKSAFYNQYAGQLYARAGLVTLAIDPVGEEERDPDGRCGTRDHDRVAMEVQRHGRPIIGKMVWDLLRGIDYLEGLEGVVDPGRIGVVGHSLGGYLSFYTAAMDDRVTLALPCGTHLHPTEHPLWTDCACIIGMHFLIMDRMSYGEILGMGAPRCATLMMLGDEDEVIRGPEVFHRGHQETFAEGRRLYAEAGAPDKLGRQVYAGAGHRPFFLSKEALLWMERHWGLPNWKREDILRLPTVLIADWAYENGVVFEQFYGTLHHYAGTLAPNVGARALSAHELACLSSEERRTDDFNIDAWARHIAKSRGSKAAVP